MNKLSTCNIKLYFLFSFKIHQYNGLWKIYELEAVRFGLFTHLAGSRKKMKFDVRIR